MSQFDGYSWNGTEPSDTSNEGISALIMTRNPAICDTAVSGDPNPSLVTNDQTNFHFVWVMVSTYNGNTQEYAQVGYFRGYNDASNYFTTEYNEYGGNYNRTEWNISGDTLPAYGQAYQYTVNWDTTTGDLDFTANGTSYGSTPFNPYSVWTTPFQTETNGETKYCGSPMPGTPSNLDGFSGISYENYENKFVSTVPSGQYSNLNCANAGNYAQTNFSRNGFIIYTN